MRKKAPISLRVNPDINANTHPYIATGLKENKFGVDIEEVISLYQLASTLPNLEIKGVGYHIGSQLTELQPIIEAFDKVYSLVKTLRSLGFTLTHLDIGGGLGVRYAEESPPSPEEYITEVINKLGKDDLTIIIEPGRAIVANAGILLTRVLYLKMTRHKNFAIVDAAMNDLLRPSLYNAYQEIVPVFPHDGIPTEFDIVGPVCETGDFLGKSRLMTLKEQDLLAVRTAGAYGFAMSSNYNSRPRAAEILVDKNKTHLIRRREEIDDLFMHEFLPSY
jgi:diaminopimelate decarboxylase